MTYEEAPDFPGFRKLTLDEPIIAGDHIVLLPDAWPRQGNVLKTISPSNSTILNQGWAYFVSQAPHYTGYWPYRRCLYGKGGLGLTLNKYHSEPAPLP
jgi:hypothetical protein